MKQMPTTEFKVKFDRVIRSVQSTKEAVLITKDRKPHVLVVAIEPGDDSRGVEGGNTGKTEPQPAAHPPGRRRDG